MQFDRDKFAEALGTSFVVKGPEGQALDLELSEVSELKDRPHQVSFSIVFLAPETWSVEQGLYEMNHEGLGPMALFLVPIGMKGSRLQLESVFNFLKAE